MTNLLYYSHKLNNVSLPEGWEWDNSETDVGTAGEHTFPATYTPEDTNNYKTLGKNLTVTVNKAKITVTANSTDKIVGRADPTFTAKIEGLVENDTLEISYSFHHPFPR